MNLPQRPPAVTEAAFSRYFKLWEEDPSQAQDLERFVSDVNHRYLHWDEMRHRDVPGGLSPQEAWSLVKVRRGSARIAPVVDAEGRPFTYRLPDPLLRPLHEVDRMAGTEIVTAPQGVLDSEVRDRVLINSLMEEAIGTSQIEGAVTTIRRGKDVLRSGRAPVNRSEQMIVNGYRTMRLIGERLDGPLDLAVLHELQSTITQNTLADPDVEAGRFRRRDDVVVEDSRDGEVIFTPPPARMLPEQINRLITYANSPSSSERDFVHPLVKASILHFWLAYLHPYADGNGRTARALFYWYMLKQGYFLFQFLTVSRVIHQSRMQYYRSYLYSERDDNDLTYFLVYKINAVQKAIANLHQQLDKIRDEQRRMMALQSASGLNARQRAVLAHALRHPDQQYTFESHQSSHGISYETSRTDLLKLIERGFLREIGGRPRTFVPAVRLKQLLRL